MPTVIQMDARLEATPHSFLRPEIYTHWSSQTRETISMQRSSHWLCGPWITLKKDRWRQCIRHSSLVNGSRTIGPRVPSIHTGSITVKPASILGGSFASASNSKTPFTILISKGRGTKRCGSENQSNQGGVTHSQGGSKHSKRSLQLNDQEMQNTASRDQYANTEQNPLQDTVSKLVVATYTFTLLLSADFQQSKLILHWGRTEQTGSTYVLTTEGIPQQ